EEISKLDLAIELLEKHGVEKDKILTTSTRRFLKFLLLRGKPRIPEFDAFY
ncbi:phosphatase, partial [Vibrio parahaemolyticus]